MKSLITGILAIAAVAVGTQGASANEHHGHFGFGITIGVPGYGYNDHYYEPRHVVHQYYGCSAKQASSIARDYGFHHRSVYVSHRTITVTGVKHGYNTEITFSRAPGCPIVSY